jgi:hypothetical protein
LGQFKYSERQVKERLSDVQKCEDDSFFKRF